MYTGIFVLPCFTTGIFAVQWPKLSRCLLYGKEKRTLPPFAAMTVGTLLVSLGVYFFKFPTTSFGGVTGLAVNSGSLPSIGASDFTFISCVCCFLLGFVFLGRGLWRPKTIYTSLLMTYPSPCWNESFPSLPLTSEPVLELGFTSCLPHCGRCPFCSLWAPAAAERRCDRHDLKNTPSAVTSARPCFSRPTLCFDGRPALRVRPSSSLLCRSSGQSLLIDNVIASMNQVKWLQVICSHPEESAASSRRGPETQRYLILRHRRLYTGERAFHPLFTAMPPREARRLQQFIADADPSAFVMISTEDLGRGF